jgi:membrane protease YdiL (CAAX protease family)
VSAAGTRRRDRVVTARGLGAVVLWSVLQGVFLLLPPLAAIAVNLLLGAVFVWWFVLRPAAVRNLPARATLRLRGPGASARWLPLLGAALVAHVIAYLVVFARFIPLPPESELLEAYLRRPFGGAAVFTLAVVIAPLLEEFFFRGWMQRTLERRYDPMVAIVVTAAAFAALHLDAFGFVVRLAFGLLVGYLAYSTRSVWPGVVLHATYNAGVMLVGGAVPQLEDETLVQWARTPHVFWPSVVVYALSALLLMWGARRLADVMRATRRGRAAPPGRVARSAWSDAYAGPVQRDTD